MEHLHHEPRSTRVTALFADHALSFRLPSGATLEDLADRLADLGDGTPVAITVKLHS